MSRNIKLLSLIVIVSTFVLTMSCNLKNRHSQQDETLTLVMAEVNPPDSVTGKFSAIFKQKVEEISRETIKIELHFQGILGDESQVMNLIVQPDSSIHLARVSASLATYGGKKSKLITIPYTFSSAEHFWKFAESDIAQEILNEPYELGLGVKGLCYGEEGFRNFFAISPLNSIDDLKGMNIRVSNAKTMQDLVKSVGAVPVTVQFTDLFAKMQTGETNAAEQPISNYYSNSFHKVAPYMILDGHNLGAVQILINSKVWDSLTNGQRRILTEAGKQASKECQKIAAEAEHDTIAKLIAEGATIIDVKDKSNWQETCKPMIEEASGKYPELYKKILELSK